MRVVFVFVWDELDLLWAGGRRVWVSARSEYFGFTHGVLESANPLITALSLKSALLPILADRRHEKISIGQLSESTTSDEPICT